MTCVSLYNIKQRSPLTTTNPIASSPHQIAIAPHHPQNPIAYSLNQNSDRTLITLNTRSPISPTQTKIAPHHPQTRSPILHIKQRSPLTTHKTRSPKSQNQTAIAPHLVSISIFN